MRKLSDILQEQADRFRRFDIPSGAESFEILADRARALEQRNIQLLGSLKTLATCSEDAISSEPHMPTHEDTMSRYDIALAEAQALITPKTEPLPAGDDDSLQGNIYG